jgi:hypothetical protein
VFLFPDQLQGDIFKLAAVFHIQTDGCLPYPYWFLYSIFELVDVFHIQTDGCLPYPYWFLYSIFELVDVFHTCDCLPYPDWLLYCILYPNWLMCSISRWLVVFHIQIVVCVSNPDCGCSLCPEWSLFPAHRLLAVISIQFRSFAVLHIVVAAFQFQMNGCLHTGCWVNSTFWLVAVTAVFHILKAISISKLVPSFHIQVGGCVQYPDRWLCSGSRLVAMFPYPDLWLCSVHRLVTLCG